MSGDDAVREDSRDLRKSPLHELHRRSGARMVPFAGWEMPLAYEQGTMAEHLACRNDAVVFDVSHLGTVRVEGPGALEELQQAFTNDLGRIRPGRAQYTHLLDAEASVLDDLIIWWVSQERFDVMPNASNLTNVLAVVEGVDATAQRAVLAVQGPHAAQRLGKVIPQVSEVGRFEVKTLQWSGSEIVVAGTGYTGEEGFEIAVEASMAPSLWESIVAEEVMPAGLGARDTLRLEAGLPLHGHELGPGISPLEAGLSWVVAWDKPGGFRGLEALKKRRSNGVTTKLMGLVTDGRQPPRTGYAVICDGVNVGEVTSGNFSPCLGQGVGLAFLRSDLKVDTSVQIDARGRRLQARVVKPPFVGHR